MAKTLFRSEVVRDAELRSVAAGQQPGAGRAADGRDGEAVFQDGALADQAVLEPGDRIEVYGQLLVFDLDEG